MNQELPNVKAGFRKDRGTNWQWSNYQHLSDHRNSNGIKKKNLLLFRWLCGKFLKKWKYRTTLLVFWGTCNLYAGQDLATVRTGMEQQTGSELGKEYVKAVYCHSAYLTSVRSVSWNAGLDEAQAGIKIAWRNINNLRYADDTIPMAESEKELKASWWKWKWRVKKMA